MGLAVVAGSAAWLVALKEPVPTWELDLTLWINDAPQWLASPLYPVMQVGTMGAPIVVALLVLVVRRDWLLAAAVVVGGLVAWFGAKGVKRAIERGRPIQYVPEIEVREGAGTGLGFISGHSAVSMYSMVVVMAVLPRSWRPVAVAVALVVGLARIVYGVHLPADVVGGWAFGAIVGVATLEVVEWLRPAPDDPGRGVRSMRTGSSLGA